MTIAQILPVLAALGLVFYMLRSLSTGNSEVRIPWMVPATLSLAFLVFSLITIAREGLSTVWYNHTQNLWGNQVWIDLLLGIGIAWAFILPHARAVGMRLPVWLLLILASGCIGVLAMVARLSYLQEQSLTRPA